MLSVLRITDRLQSVWKRKKDFDLAVKVTRFSSTREKTGNDVFTNTIVYLHWKNSNNSLYMITYTCFCFLSHGSSAYHFCQSSLLWQHKMSHSHNQLLCKHRSIKKFITTTNVFLLININFFLSMLHHLSIDCFNPCDKWLFFSFYFSIITWEKSLVHQHVHGLIVLYTMAVVTSFKFWCLSKKIDNRCRHYLCKITPPPCLSY